MSATLEQRVAALESGELERLRGLAQRRLERLREAQATVRELQSRMKAATAELADLQWAEWRAIEERDVALAERDEANAKLAAVTSLKPCDESYNAFRCLLARTLATKHQLSVWYSPWKEAWGAALGACEVYDSSPNDALVALSEKLR